MKDTQLPSISVIIPTLNSERTLELCLRSIAKQDYPPELVEIIIADAGSTDRTLEIARCYTGCTYPNPLLTGEAGKAVGLFHASHEIIALIDSDNILPDSRWFRQMVVPFVDDGEIVGAEPLEYTYRREDGFITRYCALMGMNDPLCLFLGNYDRYNAITGRWTEMPVEVEDEGHYLRITLDEKKLPTIGANGFLIRRDDLLQATIQDYLFDIDVVYELAMQGKVKYAKVKVGIVHLFSGNISTFARKQRRRVDDYLYYRKLNLRKYPWGSLDKRRLLKFAAYCIFILPLLFQSVAGYLRKPDLVWCFHPLACYITLLVYGFGWFRGLVHTGIQNREHWRQ